MAASRLPPALAARLKKRGIIQIEPRNEASDDEEIIAADYSGDDVLNTNHPSSKELSNDKLPPGWFRIKDPTSGYHYFWDSDTDKVSWLHPLDPKAVITEAVSSAENEKTKEVTRKKEVTTRWDSSLDRVPQNNQNEGVRDRLEPPKIGPSIGPAFPGQQSGKDKGEKGRHAPYQRPGRQNRDSQRKKRSRDDELDPMDPASYSDVPRGDWSSGLPMSNDAKTGADVTATGPLFQSRPYPNPGAILRANAGLS
ncbi:polyglutamine-binding protein 1-like [Antedon mediterranea]|uniref:polyglutamine-binding protein 1-like n=1 Tax=Antedon mediterranea TaxID=105859 RepID=UPI003AF63354